MSYKFEIYKDSKSEYRWRLKAGNGEVVADSGEGYVTKQSCKNGIELVRNNASGATIDDTTEAKSSYAGYRW